MPKKAVININLRESLIETMHDKIYDLLMESACRRKPIYVDTYFRCVGKTTALVNFANKCKLTLVVPNETQARYILSNFEMSAPVISQSQVYKLRGRKDVLIVYDEGVDPSILSDFNVVTGFNNR